MRPFRSALPPGIESHLLDEDTLFGLLILALVFSGRGNSVGDFIRDFRHALPGPEE